MQVAPLVHAVKMKAARNSGDSNCKCASTGAIRAGCISMTCQKLQCMTASIHTRTLQCARFGLVVEHLACR